MDQLNSVDDEMDDSDVPPGCVPLHVAERNLLSNHLSVEEVQDELGDNMFVMPTTMKNGETLYEVVFTSYQKMEVVEKSRRCNDCPEMTENFEEIRKVAVEKIRKMKHFESAERFIAEHKEIKKKKKVTTFTSGRQQCTSSKGKQQCNSLQCILNDGMQHCDYSKGKRECDTTPSVHPFPEVCGYKDVYDWSRHHGVDSNLIFSKQRHQQRMAALSEMLEIQSGLPMRYIKLPFNIDDKELFDRVDNSSTWELTKYFRQNLKKNQ